MTNKLPVNQITFEQIYPDAEYGAQLIHTRANLTVEISKGMTEQFCWNCGTLTRWFDINFGAHLCSPYCAAVKWQEYMRDAAYLQCGQIWEKHSAGLLWSATVLHIAFDKDGLLKVMYRGRKESGAPARDRYYSVSVNSFLGFWEKQRIE